MKRYTKACLFFLCLASQCFSATLAAESLCFTPPKGWSLTDSKDLPPPVQAMVVGKGSHPFPPSINLTVEKFAGSVKDYLKIVRQVNASKQSEWRDLGVIETLAGKASLSQADAVTEWGKVRMMHVILKKDDSIYILTAAALAEEFSAFYTIFFHSLKSIRVYSEADAV